MPPDKIVRRLPPQNGGRTSHLLASNGWRRDGGDQWGRWDGGRGNRAGAVATGGPEDRRRGQGLQPSRHGRDWDRPHASRRDRKAGVTTGRPEGQRRNRKAGVATGRPEG